MPRKRNSKVKIITNLAEVKNNINPKNSLFLDKLNNKQLIIRSFSKRGILKVSRVSIDNDNDLERLKNALDQANALGIRIEISPKLQVDGVWPPFIPVKTSVIKQTNIVSRGVRKGKKR